MTGPYFPRRGNDGYRITRYDLDLEYRVGNEPAGRHRAADRPRRGPGAARAGPGLRRAARRPRHPVRPEAPLRTPRREAAGPPAAPLPGRQRVRPGRDLRAASRSRRPPATAAWAGSSWRTASWSPASRPAPRRGSPATTGRTTSRRTSSASRPRRTTRSPPTASRPASAYARLERPRGRTSRPCRWPRTWPRVQIGRYQIVELDFSGSSVVQRLITPLRRLPAARDAFSTQDAMMTSSASSSGRTRSPRTPCGRDRRRAGDPDRGAGHVDLRRQPRRRAWAAQRLIAHELAHQWFGNSLTLGDWRDIWLHEGFASYAEWLWSENSGGPSADEHARNWHRQLARLPQDFVLGDPGADGPVRRPGLQARRADAARAAADGRRRAVLPAGADLDGRVPLRDRLHAGVRRAGRGHGGAGARGVLRGVAAGREAA